MIACACSGGIDSMAMTFLLSQQQNIIALIVDHSLRKESKHEAERASQILDKLGIKNEILTYKGKKPQSNIQEEARKLRYKLLTDYCKKHKITTLATAHNAEDNAETFLLRLARGSGVDGLSAIAAESKIDGLKIIRPVLSKTRQELKKILTENKIKWVEDPTNATDKYRRNKLRHALSKVEDGELITKRINETAGNLARVRDYLQTQTELALRHCEEVQCTDVAIQKKAGLLRSARNDSATLNFEKLLTFHEEIQFRVLNSIITKLSPLDERPRFESLKRLKSELEKGKTRTLAGLIFRPKQGKITIGVEKK